MNVLRGLLLVLTVGVTACTPQQAPSTRADPQPSPPTVTSSDPDPDPERGADAGVRPSPVVEHLPTRWSTIPFADNELPRRAPSDTDSLPRLLGDPTPARLVYHPTERLTDAAGWASERLLFLGVDGRWRSLDMSDLGLPEEWWPGADTYGPGALAADGRTWAAHTDAGVVLVDLLDGTVRHVDFPQSHPMVRHVTWVPGTSVVSAYAAASAGTAYRTFHVAPDGRIAPAPYDGSRTRFDLDGTPVEISTAAGGVTVTRGKNGNTHSTEWPKPADFARGTSWGVFGESQVALFAPSGKKSPLGPVAVWVLDKHTGEPQARLRVPPVTEIEGWLDEGTLVLLIDSRRLVAWQPGTERVRRLMDLPGPYPVSGEWAAATVSLALPQCCAR